MFFNDDRSDEQHGGHCNLDGGFLYATLFVMMMVFVPFVFVMVSVLVLFVAVALPVIMCHNCIVLLPQRYICLHATGLQSAKRKVSDYLLYL